MIGCSTALALVLALEPGGSGGLSGDTAEGAAGSPTFGAAVCGAGDVNGDGVPDVLVSDPGGAGRTFRFEEHGEFGRVWMLSGADASELWSAASAEADDGFGRALEVCADLNEDGVNDVLIGTNDRRPEQGGFVSVRCGASGKELVVFRGTSADLTFGRALHTIGDLDGDGFDEVAVRSLPTAERAGEYARFSICSTVDGRILRTIADADGLSYAGAGDATGDGVPDLVFLRDGIGGNDAVRLHDGASGEIVWDTRVSGAINGTVEPDSAGVVRRVIVSRPNNLTVLSAKDGAVVETLTFEEKQAVTWRIESCGDLDGDGVSDLLCSDPGYGIAWGRMAAVSGRDATMIYEIGPAPVSAWRFGYSYDFVGDLDGDDVDDYVVREDPMRFASHVWIFSGAAGRRLRVLGRDADDVRVVPEPSDGKKR